MLSVFFFFFFFNDTATTEIYTLSLHDALPISIEQAEQRRLLVMVGLRRIAGCRVDAAIGLGDQLRIRQRSEEHTSELQSLAYLVCRLLLEKKKKNSTI